LDELLLFGKPIATTDLYCWGIVNRVLTKRSNSEQEAIEIALDVSEKSFFYITKIRNYKHRLNRRLLESLDLEREFYSRTGLRRL